MNKRGIFLIIALSLATVPFSFAFDGSGDGHNISLGMFGYSIGMGAGDGYDLVVGLYDGPTGSGTGDGYDLILRNFFSEESIDADAPVVTLISPANGSTWTTGSTVAFWFNVSDAVSIESCTLDVIDGGIATSQTKLSVARDTPINFTMSLSNDNYNWSINCTDSSTNSNAGISETWMIEVDYSPPSGVSGGGGGGISCSDECTLGEIVCLDGSMYVCGNFDNDRCTEWALETCEKGYTCEEGACIPIPCAENWVCEEWSRCENGLQARECADWNECGTTVQRPAEAKSCEVEVVEEKPAVVPAPPEPMPPAPKEPSKVLEMAKKAVKYAGYSVGFITIIIAVGLAGAFAVRRTASFAGRASAYMKGAWSAEEFIKGEIKAGVPEEKLEKKAEKKGITKKMVKRKVAESKIDEIDAEIEKLGKSVNIDMNAVPEHHKAAPKKNLFSK